MCPDREQEWLFRIKGVKEGARKALWAAMDIGNNLFASHDKRTLKRQEYTWLTMDAYLETRADIGLEGEGIYLGNERLAEKILNYDYTQSARFIVDSMRLIMKGDDDGAEEALRVAARCFSASQDRGQALLANSGCVQTKNSFLPLRGQPISGTCWFGPVKLQAPVRPAAASRFSVTAVTDHLLARNLWETGECECDFHDSVCPVRIISFPNSGNIGIDPENRTVMSQESESDDIAGRRSRCLTPLPRWVAESLAEGCHAGGTCVKCGSVVTIGGVFEGMEDLVERTEHKEEASEPGVTDRKGERWAARGWGKRRRMRRKQAVCAGGWRGGA